MELFSSDNEVAGFEPAVTADELAGGFGVPVVTRRRRFRAGLNVGLGKDDTLFATAPGRVRFEDHGSLGRVISVVSQET